MENKNPFYYSGREGYCNLHKRSYIGTCPICVTGVQLDPPASPPSPAIEPEPKKYIFSGDEREWQEMSRSEKEECISPEWKAWDTAKKKHHRISDNNVFEAAFNYASKFPSDDLYGHIRQEAFVAGANWNAPDIKPTPKQIAGSIHPEDLKEVVRYIDEVLTDNLLIMCGALDGQYKIGGIVAASEYLANWFTGFWGAMDEGAEQWRSDFMDATEKLSSEGEEELDWLESFNREEVKNILMEFSYDFQQEKYGGCSTHRHIVSLFIKAHRELFSTPTPPAGAEGEGEKMEQVGLFDILDQAIDEEVAEKLSAARTTIAELEAKVKDLQDWIHSHQ